jgi:hypothetical protein
VALAFDDLCFSAGKIKGKERRGVGSFLDRSTWAGEWYKQLINKNVEKVAQATGQR